MRTQLVTRSSVFVTIRRELSVVSCSVIVNARSLARCLAGGIQLSLRTRRERNDVRLIVQAQLK